ncbi:MAG TPA: FxLYD domain-containing protein [Gemmatimonadaceae bacterium]|jgi:tetratricopeptide (TPR) repeat protein|nr:FxLYD domain-containing protein [Gemmatimonadaceae bacterium]
MAVFVRILPAAAALLVASAASLGAQQTAASQAAASPPACDAASPSNGDLLKANITLQQALKNQKTDAAGAAKALTSSVKALEGIKKPDAASSFMLGSALALWLNQPGIGLTPKRSALGFTTNPDATIDLPVAIDSLFKIAEASAPGCSYYTAFWRGGQQAYLDLVNAAINQLNADKLDSAEFYANQANRLYSESPYGHMVLGNIASKRNKNDDAIKSWQLAADAAAKDTAYRDVERQVVANIASVYLNQARDESAPKETRAAAAKKAAELYQKLVAIPGTTGATLAQGRQNLAQALLISGDSAGAAKSYSEVLTDPASHDYQDLLNAAVTAARTGKNADAAKLFEAALEKNPYSRDALFNLAVTDLNLQQYEKVGPLVARLVAVDPGNPENYLLAARAYVEVGKTRKGAAAVAVADSTVMWYSKGSQLPVEVTMAEYTPGEQQIEIAGTVLDRRDKAAAAEDAGTTMTRSELAKAQKARAARVAAMAAKPVTLKFEALDKSGAVLGSQTVTTEALKPGASAKFRVTIPAANAIAYRYTVAD